MNVLLSSAGRRGYLVEYFRAALNGSGTVVATNSLPGTSGMRAADIAEIVPPADAPEFIDALLEICRRHEIGLLCSLHDWEAPYIASARERFIEAGVVPMVASREVIDLCLDKFSTWNFMQEHGVLSPASFLSLEKAEAALDAGEIVFPLMVKPRFGQGSVNLLKVETREELRWGFRLITSQLERSGLSRFLRDGDPGQVLIQSCIGGQEYGVDIVNDLDGNFVTAFVKRKFAMRSGETDGAETVDCPAVSAAARKVAGLTRHPGILDADFFLDADGQAWLLEMNPRFGGGYPFSHVAGADLPGALIAWAQGHQPEPSMLEIRLGVRAYKDIQLVVEEAV